jgi:hypothetical protein
MAVELGSGVLASFLASNAPAINAATAAAGTAATGAAATSLLNKQDKPKMLSNPDPDSKKKRLDTERDLARRYEGQGRVSSLFNKDKLG